MKDKRKPVALAVLAVFLFLPLLLAPGILRKKTPAPGKLEPLHVVESARTPYFLPLYLAAQLGFFRDLGLDVRITTTSSEAIRAALAGATMAASGLVDPATAAAVMAGCGIAVPRSEVAASESGAVESARRIGWPVVVKLVSGEQSHKSDIGGVIVGLRGDEAVQQAYR
ncbi:MAG: acetate--CoA ligase family protein, partial [Peptococcaceae bacterium]|nr:acetate--CoA ligase family protein [Peptococcaceae bacterium]